LAAKSDRDRYSEAVHYASVARQLLNYHAALAGKSGPSGLLGIRDASAADNLAYIVDRERGRGKVLVFAHNSHLQRGQAVWPWYTFWPAGSHLDEMFGPRYAVIGSAVGLSDANGIGRPEPGTLEARLIAWPGPARFIPTHQGQGLPAAEIAALPTRSGSIQNPSYAVLTPQSFTDFDWLAVLDSTAYNRGGPPLQQPASRPSRSPSPLIESLVIPILTLDNQRELCYTGCVPEPMFYEGPYANPQSRSMPHPRPPARRPSPRRLFPRAARAHGPLLRGRPGPRRRLSPLSPL